MASSTTLFRYFSLLIMLFTFSEATEILVGGKENSWKIPSSPSKSLNKWAEKARFIIGDFLIWKYDGKVDSVLQVTKEDYESCNASKPIKEYKDGNTKVELDRSGPFYFISGAEGHCKKGQKMLVVVLSGDHQSKDPSPAPAPPLVDTPAPSPSAAPTSGLRRGFVGVTVVLGSLVGLVLI